MKAAGRRGGRMTAMMWGKDNTKRLRELAAKIATEHDHDKFTALVKEFNELVAEGKQQKSPKESQKR